jgi:dynein heavy chain
LVPHKAATESAADGSHNDDGCSSSSSSSTIGHVFVCPVYNTPERAGVLGSTGQSTNFLMHMRLPMPAGSSQAKWLLQGAAALCSVDE